VQEERNTSMSFCMYVLAPSSCALLMDTVSSLVVDVTRTACDRQSSLTGIIDAWGTCLHAGYTAAVRIDEKA